MTKKNLFEFKENLKIPPSFSIPDPGLLDEVVFTFQMYYNILEKKRAVLLNAKKELVRFFALFCIRGKNIMQYRYDTKVLFHQNMTVERFFLMFFKTTTYYL